MNDTIVGDDNDGSSFGLWPTALGYLVAVTGLTMSLVSTIFIGVVLTTLQFTFNMYVVLLMLPDLLANFADGLRYVYELTHDGALPMNLCILRYFYIYFYFFSNIYMNAVVAEEIYTLVQNSWRRRRTPPPTMRKVLVQGAAVYLYAGLVSAWLVAPVKWSPVTVTNEPFCAMTDGSSAFSPMIGRLIYLVFIVPPFLYFFRVAYKIKRENLLPLTGRTKALAMYYLRIAVVFTGFYIPITVFGVAKNSIPQENQGSTYFYLLVLTIALLIPMQNIVTIYFLLQKDDIRLSVDRLVARIPSLTIHKPCSIPTSEWNVDDSYELTNVTEYEMGANPESERFEAKMDET